MSGMQIFQCPNCGAQLEYHSSDGPTIMCLYCDTSVIVPEELRSAQPQISPELVSIDAQVAQLVRPAARSFCLVWVIALVLLVLGGVGVAFFVFNQDSLPTEPGEFDPGSILNPDPGFASVDLVFGSEGIGPGMFQDARHITVDGEGNVYVGEYNNGRIQVFNSAGEFVRQWTVDTETPLRGIAADRQGFVYIVQGGRIYRYEGSTGKMLGQLEYAEGWGFDDVIVMADGGLLAEWDKGSDDLVRFDEQGRFDWVVRGLISEHTEEREGKFRLAVDGLGNIYALGGSSNAVYRFTPEGKFVNRFGSRGKEPGQFLSPHSIAVDGQGRVYVGDANKILVFDADGRYLDVIEVDGPAFGITFDDGNALWVAAREQVIRYVVGKP